MHSLALYEQTQHGTHEFPAAYCYVDVGHPRYRMPFHWHNEWEILRILSGGFEIYMDDDGYLAREGDILLIRGGMMHGGIPENCTYECFMFDLHGMFLSTDIGRKYLSQFYQEKILPYPLFPASTQPGAGAIVDGIFRIFGKNVGDNEPGCRELETVGCISRLFSYILQNRLYIQNPEHSVAHTRRIGQIKNVLEHIEQHYNETLSLAALAEVAGMNPKYFCRVFRSVTGFSPVDYVNFYRIERAAYLLDSSELSVTAVGMECGYMESSYFTKVFKKHKGVSPRQYRESSRV